MERLRVIRRVSIAVNQVVVCYRDVLDLISALQSHFFPFVFRVSFHVGSQCAGLFSFKQPQK